MADITKTYKRRANFCKAMSIILTIVPLLVYIIIALVNGTPSEKVCMGFAVVVAAILVLLNIVFKYHIRSTVWILLLGISVCLNNITTLLIIIAITTIIDEFIFVPLHKRYKEKYVINNEIDKRR